MAKVQRESTARGERATVTSKILALYFRARSYYIFSTRVGRGKGREGGGKGGSISAAFRVDAIQ